MKVSRIGTIKKRREKVQIKEKERARTENYNQASPVSVTHRKATERELLWSESRPEPHFFLKVRDNFLHIRMQTGCGDGCTVLNT